LKEFWHFGQYVSENSKYASEYPENVTVNEAALKKRTEHR
jgi:hypothetical protein